MVCNSCAKLIQNSLSKINGVNTVSVSYENKKAELSYNGSLAESEILCKAIENIENGKFKATLINQL
jgi:copper chaperone CopZ